MMSNLPSLTITRLGRFVVFSSMFLVFLEELTKTTPCPPCTQSAKFRGIVRRQSKGWTFMRKHIQTYTDDYFYVLEIKKREQPCVVTRAFVTAYILQQCL